MIGSDNDLLQAIIWTNAALLFIRTLESHFSEIVSKIRTFWFEEYAVGNGVCNMAAILPRSQYAE